MGKSRFISHRAQFVTSAFFKMGGGQKVEIGAESVPCLEVVFNVNKSLSKIISKHQIRFSLQKDNIFTLLTKKIKCSK